MFNAHHLIVSAVALTAVACVSRHNAEPDSSPGPAAPDHVSRWDGSPADNGGEEPALASLRFALSAVQSCDDVSAMMKQRMIADMEARLRENRASLTEPCPPGVVIADVSSPGPEDDPDGATEHSTTNLQEAGVDEPDFLKNDGKYIYVLAHNRLQILDAWPPAQAIIIGSLSVNGTARRMLVHDDKAVIYATEGSFAYRQPCTYGYDCEFTGDEHNLLMTVVDLTDKTKPKKLREMMFSGSYLSARRIGDIVHTVVYVPPPAVDLSYWPTELAHLERRCWYHPDAEIDLPEADRLFDELLTENLARIEEFDFATKLPSVADVTYGSGEPQNRANPFADCEGFYLSQAGDGHSLLSVVSLDLRETADLAATTVLARPGAVYASGNALYIAIRHERQRQNFWYSELAPDDRDATTIHQFLLGRNNALSSYAGSGIVKGRVLNQFAMSEFEGDLRIATTNGRLPEWDIYNTISVLQPGEEGLEVIGQLDDIGPEEDIRAVRFRGDRAYVVTFREIDPLFVIDLSDPTAPEVLGELKIPGFSTYMHFLDAQHLLTIGFDAGAVGGAQGLALQVIDVSDETSPTLLHKEVIGERGSMSNAATDHHAFNFFRPRDLLAIPVAVCENRRVVFDGLRVYHVSVADGFSLVGAIHHGDGRNCHITWTRQDSLVKRSVFLDDYVFSVAVDGVRIAHLDDLATLIADISFERN